MSWASGGSTGPQAASTSGPERYSFMSAANSSKRLSLSTSPSANAIVSYRASELPMHHYDPFDCLLVAAALVATATIPTPNEAIQAIHEYAVSFRS